MKRLIIVLVLLLLLGGGGGVAWYVFLYESEDKIEVADLVDLAPSAPILVEVDPFAVSLMREGVVTHHLMVTVILEVESQETHSRTYQEHRRLKDAYITALHELLAYRFALEGGETRLLIEKRILRASRAILGEDKVFDAHVDRMERRLSSQAQG